VVPLIDRNVKILILLVGIFGGSVVAGVFIFQDDSFTELFSFNSTVNQTDEKQNSSIESNTSSNVSKNGDCSFLTADESQFKEGEVRYCKGIKYTYYGQFGWETDAEMKRMQREMEWEFQQSEKEGYWYYDPETGDYRFQRYDNAPTST